MIDNGYAIWGASVSKERNFLYNVLTRLNTGELYRRLSARNNGE